MKPQVPVSAETFRILVAAKEAIAKIPTDSEKSFCATKPLLELIYLIGNRHGRPLLEPGDAESMIVELERENATQAARIVELEKRLAFYETLQPMETAPRDGTWVILMMDDPPLSPRPVAARWLSQVGRWCAGRSRYTPDVCLGWYALPGEVSRG